MKPPALLERRKGKRGRRRAKGHCLGGMTADKELMLMLMLMPLFLAAEGRGDPLFVLVLVLMVCPYLSAPFVVTWLSLKTVKSKGRVPEGKTIIILDIVVVYYWHAHSI